MKPHPKLRKTIKWGGAAVTALLVVVWVGSGWWNIEYAMPRQGLVALRYGRVEVFGMDPRLVWEGNVVSVSGPGVSLNGPEPSRFTWWGGWKTDSLGWRAVVPLWLPAGATLGMTIAVCAPEMLARRRARVHHCPKCNYDRAGIAKDAVCPECGERPRVV
ncbi:MAG TPA: hypothetical protein PKE29_04825, partial [Phycisphaerales bacterium]|nr:hypothetical protein [Phycisphaerales bacterium]